LSVTKQPVTQADLALKAPLASPTFTGTVTLPSGLVLPANTSIPSSATGVTQAVGDNSTKLATTAFVQSLLGNGILVVSYDTTGAVGASSALQAAIDTGARHIIIPPGIFKCDAAVFDDLITNDANDTLLIDAFGVRFEATSSLPTVAFFETNSTNLGWPTGAKWFFFPNTSRSALSGGVVTTTNNYVTPTYQSRVPVNPRVVIRGATWSAINLTKYNAGFLMGNRGGSFHLEDCHLSSGRFLFAWDDYVDGNVVQSCSAWGAAVMDATYDAWVGIVGGGDAFLYDNVKVDNWFGHCNVLGNNGASYRSLVGGFFSWNQAHGQHVQTPHMEQANDGTQTRGYVYYIKNSNVVIDGGVDYSTDSFSNVGQVYLDDDKTTEGLSSHVELRNYVIRDWMTTSDPTGGHGIYINKMANGSRIRCRGGRPGISAGGSLYFSWGYSGIKITGNATNEPSLAAALVQCRDLIASGDFDLVKYDTATAAAGQGSVIPIVGRQIGNLANLRQTRLHATPTFYDAETVDIGVGTLSNGTTYNYAAALCNTLPDSTLEYGQATAGAFGIVAGASGANAFELYMPSAPHGATLVVWRSTGAAAVQSAADRYVIIPVNTTTSKFHDTGANICKYPWITTSVPQPATVAGSNHTSERLWFNTTAVTVP
jgi:hypothetical protein